MRYKNPKPKKSKKGTVVIVVGVLVVLGIIGSQMGDDKKPATTQKDNITAQAQVDSAPPEKEPVLQPFTTELQSGHYTAGIDIPSGTYNVTVVSGNSGNVSSSNLYNGGINAVMGESADDIHISEFKNLKLPKGETLSVSGLTIKIESPEVDPSSVIGRADNTAEEITLSSGNFVAGTDFKAGVYNVELVEGLGNVSSNNMYDGGLNIVIGDGSDGFSINSFQNVDFKAGIELSVSGVTIKLTPSK